MELSNQLEALISWRDKIVMLCGRLVPRPRPALCRHQLNAGWGPGNEASFVVLSAQERALCVSIGSIICGGE